MKLFILRHGQAEPALTTDAARRLTEQGREETRKLLMALLPLITMPSGIKQVPLIWASPLVRAQQTAQIAQACFATLGDRQDVQTTHYLEPETHLDAVLNWVDSLQQESVFLVSHQPLVGQLVNQLCGVAASHYAMGTSSLAAIETDVIARGMGKMLWLRHAN